MKTTAETIPIKRKGCRNVQWVKHDEHWVLGKVDVRRTAYFTSGAVVVKVPAKIATKWRVWVERSGRV